MKDLVAYLSTPFAHEDINIRQLRFEIVTKVAAEFMQQGIFIYSPITHNVPLKKWGMDGD